MLGRFGNWPEAAGAVVFCAASVPDIMRGLMADAAIIPPRFFSALRLVMPSQNLVGRVVEFNELFSCTNSLGQQSRRLYRQPGRRPAVRLRIQIGCNRNTIEVCGSHR